MSPLHFQDGANYTTQHGDLPSPPFSMVFGTLAGLGEVMKACPDDTSPAPLMTLLFQKYKLGPIYYLDNWPAIYCRQMVINDPVSDSKPPVQYYTA